jgi:site-specific DNA-methyltransferase (cytosine-N4-specific)
VRLAFQTSFGASYHGVVEDLFASDDYEAYSHRVDLIFTSPPFPLNHKKKYGNLQGQEYVDWLVGLVPYFKDLLKPTGSIVIEMGNSWTRGSPVMSTLALEALLEFLKAGEMHLCQQFIWHNPARLPSPAQWVNVERIRVKDAFTHLWWMSPTSRPKADNRRVLTEYSSAMKSLLRTGKYNGGKRPSEHSVNKHSFVRDNGGAIPSNVIQAANTQSNDEYLRYCRNNEIRPHPARMPTQVAEFFIKYLTEPGDLVMDPFAGSNTTGAAAERLNRKWVSVEPNSEYISGSLGRFQFDSTACDDATKEYPAVDLWTNELLK